MRNGAALAGAGAVSDQEHDRDVQMAGTVRKRTWVTRKGETKTAWLADYFDQHRKRHKRQFATKKAASDWLDTVRYEVKTGIHAPDAESITVAEAAELWLSGREAQRLERGTLRTYRGYVDHIVPLIGKVKLTRLTPPMVEGFADELVKRVSWQRAGRILTCLKMIISTALRRGLAKQNVALPVKVDSEKRDQRPLMVGIDVPSRGEIQAIVQSVTGRFRPRLITAIFTGLRASELRGLCWQDIDFERRTLRVRQRADQWGDIGKPKSKNGYREVPLSPSVANTLREWKVACPPRQGEAPDLVFPGQNGGVLDHTGLQKGFETVQRAAGVVDDAGKPKYSLHALRHFYASWRIERRTEPKRLQQLMGHGSIKMTYDVYGHWLGDAAEEHARLAEDEMAVLGPALVGS
jgi:integrase